MTVDSNSDTLGNTAAHHRTHASSTPVMDNKCLTQANAYNASVPGKCTSAGTVKSKIFGLNAARIYSVDPQAKQNPIPGYELR